VRHHAKLRENRQTVLKILRCFHVLRWRPPARFYF